MPSPARTPIAQTIAAALIGSTAASCTLSERGTGTAAPRQSDRVARAGQVLKGTVGIVVVEMGDKPRLPRPGTPNDAFSTFAGGFTAAAGGAIDPNPASPVIASTLLLMAPLAGAMGSSLGVDAAEIGKSDQVLRASYASAKPWTSVRGGLTDRLRQLGGRPVFVRHESFPQTSWHERDPAYFKDLARRGIPTALVVEFFGHSLEGKERINPKLGLTTRLDGWLVDTSTGRGIGSATITAHSSKRMTFANWAADDGAAYKEAMREASAQACKDLIAEFTPPPQSRPSGRRMKIASQDDKRVTMIQQTSS